MLVFFSEAAASVPLGACTLYLDLNAYGTVGLYQTNGAGAVQIPIPISAAQPPADLVFQGAPFTPSPSLFGLIDLTNGIKVRFASSGCD